MIFIKKSSYKPIYKNFLNSNNDLKYKKKVYNFKKKKWQFLLFKLNLITKYKKRNCYYQFFDQNSYSISKHKNYFSKNYKQETLTKKSFKLFYGNLGKKYIKNLVSNSISKSNQLKNKVNAKSYLINSIESRLDVTLLRANFALSVRSARQLISHEHVIVNNKVVTDSSCLLKEGDVITFSSKGHKLIKYYIALSGLWPLPPGYLQVSYKLLQIKFLENVLTLNTGSKSRLYLHSDSILKSYM